MGLFDPGMDNNTLTINLINYGFNNNLISTTTKDFMLNELSVYAISDDTIKVDFQNFLTNNNNSLTDFEKAFINSFIINESSKRIPCVWVGRIVGFGAGLLLGAVTGGVAAGVGSLVFGDVGRVICESY